MASQDDDKDSKGEASLKGTLKSMPPHIVWNAYRQLSFQMMEKASEMKYSEIEQNFKYGIMDKLKSHLMEMKLPVK